LEDVIVKINDNLVPVSGIVAPTTSAVYIGQLYVDTVTPALYYAKSIGLGASDWVRLQNF
jgi:hypothetical protein